MAGALQKACPLRAGSPAVIRYRIAGSGYADIHTTCRDSGCGLLGLLQLQEEARSKSSGITCARLPMLSGKAWQIVTAPSNDTTCPEVECITPVAADESPHPQAPAARRVAVTVGRLLRTPLGETNRGRSVSYAALAE